MKLSILAGSTSQTINVFVRDSSSTTGGGLTGLVFNSASLTAYYGLPRAAAVSITLATLAAATSAWSSGGFKEIDATNMPGWYRFDIPDAAIASGRFVSLHFKGATNMAPLPVEIELTAWNNQDGTRGGMTALPNAAAAASGGLITFGTGTGQLNVSGGRADNNTLYWNGSAVATPDTAGYPKVTNKTGSGTGELDLTSGVIKANTTQLAGQTVTAAAGVTFPTSVASPTNITAGTITTVTTLTNLPAVTSNWLTAAGIADGAIDRATFAADTGLQCVRANTAQAGAASTITLDASASAVTDFYKGTQVSITGGTGVGQTRLVTAYNGTTKVATVTPSWATNPDNTSTFAVENNGSGVDLQLVSGQTVTAAAGVTFPSSIASPTNITAGTITTVTNLTNAATSGDLTATMKTSVTTAATAATPTAAAVTARVTANTDQLAGQTVTAAAGVTFPTSVASPTNITAGTITTVTTLTNLPAVTSNWLTAAGIADGAIDRATFAADTGLSTTRSNTAQAGAAGTITLDASASATTDFYKGAYISLTGGTGSGQARLITAYNSTTKVATITPNWATNPDNTSTFAVVAQGSVDVQAYGGTVGTFSAGRPEVNATHIAGSSVATGTAQIGVNVVSYASGQAPLQPTTAGRTLDVAATGEAGLDFDNIKQATGATTLNNIALASTALAAVTAWTVAITGNITGNLSGSVGSVTGAVGSVTGAVGSVTGAVGSVTGAVGSVTGAVGSVTARVTANTDQLAGQTVTAAAGVTFPTSVASPTNITAGTITTVTNLTNAATSGDLTATMKTSVTTAATAATPTAAAVTGNVGGSVGSLVSVANILNGSLSGYGGSDNVGGALKIIKQFASGKKAVNTGANTLTVYDTDGTTTLFALNLTPGGGPYTTQAP